MIPPDYRDLLVGTGIDFLSAITTAYGSDEGMKIWETFASSIDPELKGAIFFALLSGDSTASITSIRVTKDRVFPVANLIGLIKCIRAYDARGLGLKEAKDLADEINSGKSVILKVRFLNKKIFTDELKNLNCRL